MRSSMHRKRLSCSLLMVGILASLLSACARGPLIPPAGETGTPAAVTEAAPSATPSAAPEDSAGILPTRPAPPTAAITPTARPRPRSGWTVYSNPDFIRGIAVYERQLWAATLGGVVAWDLDTGRRVLYTTGDGLVEIQGNDAVYCPMPEDRIVIAHEHGPLSVYDLNLKKWSPMPITFKDGSTVEGVQTLLCDIENRRLLAGSTSGLAIYHWNRSEWSRIGPEEGLKVETIRSIDVVGQTIWIAAGDESAFVVMGENVFPFKGTTAIPPGRINDVAVASDAAVWLGYPTGLVRYRDRHWRSFGAQVPYGIPFFSIDLVEIGPDDRVWISGSREGVCPLDEGQVTCSTLYHMPNDALITDLVVAADGTAYAGTAGEGVLALHPDQAVQYAMRQDQLISNEVMDLAEDHAGNLWIATDRGVNILDPYRPQDPWQAIRPQRDRLLFPHVTGLQPDDRGMWLFYNQDPHASFFDGERWHQVDDLRDITGPVLSSAVDSFGYTWIAAGQGVFVWDGVVLRQRSPDGSSPNLRYQALRQLDDAIWLGTSSGLYRYRRYQWQLIIPDIAVNAIAPDQNGGLLLGTDEGLVRFDGSQSYFWLINLGDEVVKSPKVTSIAWDGSGQLWVGTDGSGVFYYDGGQFWEQVDTTRVLPTNRVRKLYADRLGSIWIATFTGSGGGALARYVP